MAWKSHRRSETPSRSKSIAAPAASTRLPLKFKTPSGSPGARVPPALTVTLLR